MLNRRMDRAAFEGIELEYAMEGAGEPVVLMHPGHFADWFMPLMKEPTLTDGYRLLAYHRAGCAGSSQITEPYSIAQQADQCRSLMRHLEIERAHIVGHSSSGNIALQLALDVPDVVHSLALLEPALVSILSGQTSTAPVDPPIPRYLQLYRAGDKAEAIDAFLKEVCGPGYRAVLDQALPGAFDQHVADADTFFGYEAPAVIQWPFTREDANRVTQPVLVAVGAKSNAGFRSMSELLISWLPNVDPLFVLPDGTHLMQVENPSGMADGLAGFFARHPLSS